MKTILLLLALTTSAVNAQESVYANSSDSSESTADLNDRAEARQRVLDAWERYKVKEGLNSQNILTGSDQQPTEKTLVKNSDDRDELSGVVIISIFSIAILAMWLWYRTLKRKNDNSKNYKLKIVQEEKEVATFVNDNDNSKAHEPKITQETKKAARSKRMQFKGTSLSNKLQLLSVVIIFVMCLFPPWKVEQYEGKYNIIHNAGHQLIWQPPMRYAYPQKQLEAYIDLPMLGIQLLPVVTLLIVLVIKDKRNLSDKGE